jgi:uncharacterized phage protein gp47/JayE
VGQLQIKVYEDILDAKIARVVARTDLTDVNDGSSLKQVLAASSRADDEQYFQMLNLLDLFDIDKATGDNLDERAKELQSVLQLAGGGITRVQARRSTGAVVFSRTGTIGSVTIPIGTEVKVPAVGAQADIVFTTTEEGTISGGSQDSNAVDVRANAAGATGNVDPTEINGFVTKPSGVDSVSNPSSLTNGLDLESDDSFRRRIKLALKGLARCHPGGLVAAALGVEDPAGSGKTVVFANVVESIVDRGEVTLYIDDGSGTAESTAVVTNDTCGLPGGAAGGEVDIYTSNKPIKPGTTFTFEYDSLGGGGWVTLDEGDDYTLDRASGHIKLTADSFPSGLVATDEVRATYTHFTGLIQEVQKVIDGDAADRSNYPGYRASGVRVTVLSPAILYLIVRTNITISAGYSQSDSISAVEAALSDYVNSLGISEDAILNELRERTMAVEGVFDCAFQAPTDNTVVLDNQIARLIASNLTVN